MLALATKVVSDYGKVLAHATPGLYGLPLSLLPHSKDQIRRAIKMLLKNIGPEHAELKEGLTRGYVYLAQFVPDAEAEQAALGQTMAASTNATANSDTESAMRVINNIKLDMERALEELHALGA